MRDAALAAEIAKRATCHTFRHWFAPQAVLAHLRDHKRLSRDDIRRLGRGTYLRKEAQDEVLGVLGQLGLIGHRQSALGATLRKNLFKDDIRIK